MHVGLRYVGHFEGVLEIENIVKIFNAVVLGLPEYAKFNEIKYDIPEVAGFAQAPFIEQGRCHGAILIQSVLPDSMAQLRPGDVPLVG